MILICDIDGVIAELTAMQINFIKEKEKEANEEKEYKPISKMTWANDYYSYIPYQLPIESNVKIVEQFLTSEDIEVRFITSRSEIYKESTKEWLFRTFGTNLNNSGKLIDIDWDKCLFMRNEKDFRPSHEVKEDYIKALKRFYCCTFLVFEDDPDCRAMYKRHQCFLIYPPKLSYFTKFKKEV